MTPSAAPESTHRPTIVGLGEVLWDVFPDGERFGGAPANFACAVAELAHDQADVCMVSGVGRDELGRRAFDSLAEHRVDATHIATVDRPTGTVIVELNRDASANYEFADDTAWDNNPWSDTLEQLAMRTHAVCFGTLGQRSTVSRRTIQQFLAAMSAASLRVLDVNLRPPFVSDRVLIESLQIANVLKLSDEELPELVRMCDLTGTTDVDKMRQLSRRFDLAAIALTRGPEGAVLLRGDEVIDCGGVDTEVVDTVGAGDAFAAAFVLGLLNNRPLDQIGHDACHVAAYVCSQRGATPHLPPSITT
jgi:fructokinase